MNNNNQTDSNVHTFTVNLANYSKWSRRNLYLNLLSEKKTTGQPTIQSVTLTVNGSGSYAASQVGSQQVLGDRHRHSVWRWGPDYVGNGNPETLTITYGESSQMSLVTLTILRLGRNGAQNVKYELVNVGANTQPVYNGLGQFPHKGENICFCCYQNIDVAPTLSHSAGNTELGAAAQREVRIANYYPITDPLVGNPPQYTTPMTITGNLTGDDRGYLSVFDIWFGSPQRHNE